MRASSYFQVGANSFRWVQREKEETDLKTVSTFKDFHNERNHGGGLQYLRGRQEFQKRLLCCGKGFRERKWDGTRDREEGFWVLNCAVGGGT